MHTVKVLGDGHLHVCVVEDEALLRLCTSVTVYGGPRCECVREIP